MPTQRKPMRRMSARKEAELRAKNNGALPRTTFKPKPDGKPLQRTQLNAARAYATTQEEQEGLQHSTLRPGDKPLERHKRMRQVSKKQRKVMEQDAAMKERLAAIWGGCILCGNPEFDPEHAFTKGAHPEWRFEEWNLLPVCRVLHNRKHAKPEVDRAFKRLANERKAVDDGNRPPMSDTEARGYILAALGGWTCQQHIGSPKHKRKEAANDVS